MPQVKITEEAKQDLGRFADFLTENGALEQAKTVINVILQGLRILEQHPLSGRHYTLDGVSFRAVNSTLKSYSNLLI